MIDSWVPPHALRYSIYLSTTVYLTSIYQEGVRSTGLLRTVLTAVMRRVNRSSTSELNAKQRACASLIERKVLESGLI